MPEVSRFYGIVITFNYVDHFPPHFHARYGDDRATVSLERDLTDVLIGPVFEPIIGNDDLFRRVEVDYGTLVWPGEVDIAPETLIWDGPYPHDEATRLPEPYLRPRGPQG